MAVGHVWVRNWASCPAPLWMRMWVYPSFFVVVSMRFTILVLNLTGLASTVWVSVYSSPCFSAVVLIWSATILCPCSYSSGLYWR